ncbi:helix-turn-helix domain-containing protein [Flagellimonas sp. HMM57]|uniref:helix-turn-helix transcriptional regulator n=1 Tax=unclassified Flagellimonas TaxID=2644544 RepID=UPI0013D115BD|nr:MULTISPECIES: helix-turn-helix domain-containing protein [unclassified Flagellimonas]UII75820.1 helix-turn-helix domain-containing protein [Flagellimonas sp. HMM57]
MTNFTIQYIIDQIVSNEKTVEEISTYLPLYLHINDADNFKPIAFCPKLMGGFDIAKEDLQTRGALILAQSVHVSDLQNAVRLNENYLKNSDQQHHVEFAQRIHYAPTQFSSTFYTIGKVVDKRIVNMSIPIDSLGILNNLVMYFFEEADYIKRHQYKYDLLSSRELEVAGLFGKGYSASEIATFQKISTNAVKKYRKNIYRKIEVDNYFALYHFCRVFNLL